MKLTPRLQTIADSIKNCNTLADIGTDHAHLPIYLTKQDVLMHAIASDINKGPIEIAEARIRQNGLQNKIETRQGSGLSVLKPREAEIIVIAGMGGILISEILEQDKEVAEAAELLILQPMQDSGKLRKYLVTHGFEIIDEELAKEESKLYEILWVKPKGRKQEAGEFMDIGSKLVEKKHPLLIELLEKKKNELNSIIPVLQQSNTVMSQKRLEECMKLINYYNEVKKWVQ